VTKQQLVELSHLPVDTQFTHSILQEHSKLLSLLSKQLVELLPMMLQTSIGFTHLPHQEHSHQQAI
jgi:hypothetical protein